MLHYILSVKQDLRVTLLQGDGNVTGEQTFNPEKLQPEDPANVVVFTQVYWEKSELPRFVRGERSGKFPLN